MIDTGGLPYEIIFVVGKPYMITANIDVADGLTDVAVGKLSHVELSNQNRVMQVWLLFPSGVGVKARGKVPNYANVKGIDTEMVSVNRRSATVPSTEIGRFMLKEIISH
ncbi:ATP-dependent DNA helicase [Trichonephila inaurata madagascariensis]|uniref:ATP-dependent DNA helicase n=1 Tax=Trichonephila inaurata madagascariensis TaxID=2747483 RepID=A0A8X7CJ57_9ARAC|nr:ATP-dependent DNA helicase [Trichonephila inaurata madagascariensis]